MQVEIYGTLRMLTGEKSLRVDLPGGATFGELLEAVFQRCPALRSELLGHSGRLRQDMPVFVNGRNPRLWADYLNKVLQPEDTLSLFSPVSSGAINVEVLSGSGRKMGKGGEYEG